MGIRDTADASYTERLAGLEGAWWKRVLDVQAPYRWNLRRLLGDRPTIDVGCGIGRNLRHLAPGSVGVDHNPTSVARCRERGLEAYLPAELPEPAAPYRGLLAAHLIEHLDADAALAALRPHVARLAADARVVLICPQERGYRSDATHVRFVDQAVLAGLCAELGLHVERAYSFPFPRAAGRRFTYNEFVTAARP